MIILSLSQKCTTKFQLNILLENQITFLHSFRPVSLTPFL